MQTESPAALVLLPVPPLVPGWAAWGLFRGEEEVLRCEDRDSRLALRWARGWLRELR